MKIWVLFGVLVAGGIGGGLGMLAFHYTAPKPPPVVVTPATSAPPPPSAPASISAAPSASALPPPPPEPKSTTIHITSDPPGAAVHENNKELCAATPCDVTFKGDDATKPHKLVLDNKGFKSETRTVKTSDAAKGVDIKLTKIGGGGPAPAPAPVRPPAPTPSGFKDAYDK